MSTSGVVDVEIGSLAPALVQGRTDMLGRLFGAQGMPCPLLIWNPLEMDVGHPVLRAFIRAVANAPKRNGLLTEAFLEHESYCVLKDWTLELEAEPDLDDFVYRHYGSEVAFAFGRDLTGYRVSDFGGYLSTFFLATYHAVLERRETVMTQHEPDRQTFVRNWRRVIVPVYDDADRLSRLIVANVADNELRAGLEVVPDAVIVATGEGKLCFANRPASALFAQPRNFKMGVSVESFMGVELELPARPEAMVRQGHSEITRRIVIENGMVTPIEISVSATIFRSRAFYIIMARRG